MLKIIPIFLPQAKCPYKCIFCNQRKAVGSIDKLSATDIESVISEALKRQKRAYEFQVAFYGGSFTLLSNDEQREYLRAVNPFIRNGTIQSIRISTRPDALDEEVVGFLGEHGVDTVELGVQIMDDDILSSIKRDHNTADVIQSVRLLRKSDIKAGLQIMIGLPGETLDRRRQAWRKVINLRPDYLRIHPTIVLSGSELEKMYTEGEYIPLSFEEAVDICSQMVVDAELNNIKVIRIGLQSSPSLQIDGAVLAGPWHPSFGQMVKSEIFFKLINVSLSKLVPLPRFVTIYSSISSFNDVRGLSNSNVARIKEIVPDIEFKFDTDDGLAGYDVIIEGSGLRISADLRDVIKNWDFR